MIPERTRFRTQASFGNGAAKEDMIAPCKAKYAETHP